MPSCLQGKDMIQILNVLLIVCHVFFDYPYALEMLTGMMVIFSLVYYYTNFTVIAGLSEASLIEDLDQLTDSLTSTLMQWTSIIIIYVSAYQVFAYFVLPWVMMSTGTLIFSLLLAKKVLEIKDVDDED